MNLFSELSAIPGVLAAGEYSFHGDRLSFHHRGRLSDEQASMASIMCRANTMALHMQADLLDAQGGPVHGLAPCRGWMVRGPRYTVCVHANVFCFVANDSPHLNAVAALMGERLAHAGDGLVY